MAKRNRFYDDAARDRMYGNDKEGRSLMGRKDLATTPDGNDFEGKVVTGRQYLSGKSNGMLVKYDAKKFSNLPTDPVLTEWPKASYYAGWDLDDTITGVNDQIGTDGAKMKKNSARAGYKY